MFRPGVSILLVFLLLLQGMVFVPCQGDGCPHGPAGHDNAPHFHLCMLGLHDHEDGHHRPTHHDGGTDKDEETVPQCPASDDDDAVYTSGSAMLAGRDESFRVGLAEPGNVTLGAADVDLVPLLNQADSVPPATPLGPCPDCPIYLRTLALLI